MYIIDRITPPSMTLSDDVYKWIYTAPSCETSKTLRHRSQCYLQTTLCLSLPCKRSPDGAATDCDRTRLMTSALTTSSLWAGASIPPNTLEQVPPSPSPLLSRSPPLPSFPLEVRPLIAARGLGSAFAPPAGPGGARTPNGIWWNSG